MRPREWEIEIQVSRSILHKTPDHDYERLLISDDLNGPNRSSSRVKFTRVLVSKQLSSGGRGATAKNHLLIRSTRTDFFNYSNYSDLDEIETLNKLWLTEQTRASGNAA